MKYSKGFTLIELAIVLTIIAAVLAAVTGGIAMKKQAEIRGVITEMEQYKDSFTKFTELYKAVPGDFDNAQALWAGDCAITITCNGDGNGAVNAYWASSTNETARAWKHMQRADVISYLVEQVPAAYTGNLNYDLAPKSKYWDGGYYMAVGGDIGGFASLVASPFNSVSGITNGLFLGKPSPQGGFTVAAMSPKDAYNIDAKIDDGGISTGGVATGAGTGYFRATDGESSVGGCLSGGNYIVTSDGITCMLGYQLDNR